MRRADLTNQRATQSIAAPSFLVNDWIAINSAASATTSVMGAS